MEIEKKEKTYSSSLAGHKVSPMNNTSCNLFHDTGDLTWLIFVIQPTILILFYNIKLDFRTKAKELRIEFLRLSLLRVFHFVQYTKPQLNYLVYWCTARCSNTKIYFGLVNFLKNPYIPFPRLLENKFSRTRKYYQLIYIKGIEGSVLFFGKRKAINFIWTQPKSSISRVIH